MSCIPFTYSQRFLRGSPKECLHQVCITAQSALRRLGYTLGWSLQTISVPVRCQILFTIPSAKVLLLEGLTKSMVCLQGAL